MVAFIEEHRKVEGVESIFSELQIAPSTLTMRARSAMLPRGNGLGALSETSTWNPASAGSEETISRPAMLARWDATR